MRFSIDSAFCLMQLFIDIYPTCIDEITDQDPITDSEQSDIEGSGELRQRIISSALSSIPELDKSSILLILSCHMRLSHIKEALR